MVAMYLPFLVVVLSNAFYHLAAKATPEGLNPYASLSVTYAVGTIASLALYFVTVHEPHLIAEYRRVNWSPIVLGLCVVGLEAGFIYMYRAGWSVGTAQLTQAAFVTIVLVILGALMYGEAVTPKKLAGVVVSIIGMYLLGT